MIIKFSPQVRLGAINYLFVKAIGDVLYVKYEDREEEYDFTLMGEGELQSVQSDNITIEPLFEAKRTKDNLYVTLYRPIPATNDESLNFPEDIDTSTYDLSEYDKDPMFTYIKEQKALENLAKEMENPIEVPDTPTDDENEDLGESEVTKLTENGYSKEENIDYNPIVSETYEEPKLEPVPDIEVPDPIEPDDDLLKTPEFTDVESALEQAFLEEEERKLQEELARQRELGEEFEVDVDEEVVVEEPTEYPIEKYPIEPPHSDEVDPSEDANAGEHDYASEEETALEDNTELNNEVDNNG